MSSHLILFFSKILHLPEGELSHKGIKIYSINMLFHPDCTKEKDESCKMNRPYSSLEKQRQAGGEGYLLKPSSLDLAVILLASGPWC